MNIILLAPPAAGKGTQAELLEQKYHLNHLSTGDLLRASASREDAFGKEMKKILESGVLVSDDIIFKLLDEYLEESENKNLLFDGFPRNINQAERLENMLKERNDQLDFVFLLEVEKEILETRITGRRLCRKCGSVYNVNINSLKPKQNSICDKCGGELYQRNDDNKDSFEVRYQEYLDKTSTLINYYQNKKILYRIDSEKPKEEVFQSISNIIEKEMTE
ncbi:MAG: adenylate kinase [Bacilli bacterium]|nr:adenylate kinase [Bacilli bacterium]